MAFDKSNVFKPLKKYRWNDWQVEKQYCQIIDLLVCTCLEKRLAGATFSQLKWSLVKSAKHHLHREKDKSLNYDQMKIDVSHYIFILQHKYYFNGVPSLSQAL